jgi:hypothetical protein
LRHATQQRVGESRTAEVPPPRLRVCAYSDLFRARDGEAAAAEVETVRRFAAADQLMSATC